MERCTPHSPGSEVQVTQFVIAVSDDNNGYDIQELMRSNQLVAISTHGDLAFAVWDPSSLGLHDHTPHRRGPRKSEVDNRIPFGFSGFRYHRPLFARICTRARWKWRQPEEEKTQTMGQSTVGERERDSIGFCRSGKVHRSQFGRTVVPSTPTKGTSSCAQRDDDTRH